MALRISKLTQPASRLAASAHLDRTPEAVIPPRAADSTTSTPREWVREGLSRPMRFLPAFILATSLAAQSPPAFSGVWQLNKEKSRVDLRMAWANVELTDAAFSVNLRVFPDNGLQENFDWHFNMDSTESSNLMHDAPMKSRLERDGGALVVRSVATFGSDHLNTVARWTASADGQVLTNTETHQYASEPERASLFVFERRPASAWATLQSQPAGQVYKNIRILRSVPAERLSAVMAAFNRSLGVQCKHCHVAGDFAADTNPAKTTARKMLDMVGTINKQSFAGSDGITCWTCHRGSVKPERVQSPAAQR